MMRYIALLRGINVGGNKKVEMKKLKNVFESFGFKAVSTYINSGNVIFETDIKNVDDIIAIIERGLRDAFGFDIRTIVRSAQNIEKLMQTIPARWKNDSKQKTDVLFLWDEFDNEKSINLIKMTKGVDNLKYISGVIVWNVDKKQYPKSGMHKFIGTVVYKNMTARNVNTVRKLAELIGK